MSWWLLLALAVLTFGSRLLGLVAVPEFAGRVRDAVEAVPAPLFAALAGALLVVDRGFAAPPVLAAFAGAFVAVLVRRTLLVALLGGLVGWGVAVLVL